MKGIKQPKIHYKIYLLVVIYEFYAFFFFLKGWIWFHSSSYELSFHLSDDVSTVKKEQILAFLTTRTGSQGRFSLWSAVHCHPDLDH